MPRASRFVLPGRPHHITHRGNYRQQVFFSDADRHMYLDLFRESAERAQVRLWGWCLLNNHVHWILVPETETGLAALFRRAHGSYARYRHLLRRTTGHLWQARFYSSVLDESYRWYALAYVERNPVRAGLVRAAEEYRWSSAAVHVGTASPPEWLDVETWRQAYRPEDWQRVLATSVGQEADERRLREATRANLPWATPGTLAEWSVQSGRDLHWRPVGRPSRDGQVPLVWGSSG